MFHQIIETQTSGDNALSVRGMPSVRPVRLVQPARRSTQFRPGPESCWRTRFVPDTRLFADVPAAGSAAATGPVGFYPDDDVLLFDLCANELVEADDPFNALVHPSNDEGFASPSLTSTSLRSSAQSTRTKII